MVFLVLCAVYAILGLVAPLAIQLAQSLFISAQVLVIQLAQPLPIHFLVRVIQLARALSICILMSQVTSPWSRGGAVDIHNGDDGLILPVLLPKTVVMTIFLVSTVSSVVWFSGSSSLRCSPDL